MNAFVRPSIRRFRWLGRLTTCLPIALAAVVVGVAALRAEWPPGVGESLLALWPALLVAPIAGAAGVAALFAGRTAGTLCQTLSDVPPVLLAAPALALGVVAPGFTLALAALVMVAPRAYAAAGQVAPVALESGLALGLRLPVALLRVWLPMVTPAVLVATLRGLSRTVGVAAPLVALGHAGLLPAAIATGAPGVQAGATTMVLLLALGLEAAALVLEARQ